MNLLIRHLLIFAVLLIASNFSQAAPRKSKDPKATPCKVFNTDNCVKRSLIPKGIRNKFPVRTKFVAPLQLYPFQSAGTLAGFPNVPAEQEPLILIPAGTETLSVCGIFEGVFKCVLLTQFKECPTNIPVQNESGAWYKCDVDCSGSGPNGKPDANGNCDCDINLGSCVPD